MIILTPHAHNDPQFTGQVMLDIKKDNDYLIAEFQVKSKALNTDDNFSLNGWENEGLWNFDVVELFLKRESTKRQRYLELEISPLGQKVAILFKSPRVRIDEYKPESIEASSTLTAEGFNAYFKIALNEIPGEGSVLLGNAHACLGKESRNYFSLFDIDSSKVDFHCLENFQKIDTI